MFRSFPNICWKYFEIWNFIKAKPYISLWKFKFHGMLPDLQEIPDKCRASLHFADLKQNHVWILTKFDGRRSDKRQSPDYFLVVVNNRQRVVRLFFIATFCCRFQAFKWLRLPGEYAHLSMLCDGHLCCSVFFHAASQDGSACSLLGFFPCCTFCGQSAPLRTCIAMQ